MERADILWRERISTLLSEDFAINFRHIVFETRFIGECYIYHQTCLLNEKLINVNRKHNL